MKFGVIQFPGSNCDHDCFYSSSVNTGAESVYMWHKDTELPSDIDCVIVPGGFSYGDYLRCGAVARFAPIMNAVSDFAKKGGYVIGICNGFQILTEAGLLPGALLQNESQSFICKDTYLKVAGESPFTKNLNQGDILKIPIAHGEGNYYADDDTIKMLQDTDSIAFYYSDINGLVDKSTNPNGSLLNIAGITNKSKNVLGMMPHLSK
jgi:phosphoribosylformylglycinamidine synthase